MCSLYWMILPINTTIHTIKPLKRKSDFFAEYNKESNEKDPKFKVGDQVRMSKCKIIIGKDMLLIGVKKSLR